MRLYVRVLGPVRWEREVRGRGPRGSSMEGGSLPQLAVPRGVPVFGDRGTAAAAIQLGSFDVDVESVY